MSGASAPHLSSNESIAAAIPMEIGEQQNVSSKDIK